MSHVNEAPPALSSYDCWQAERYYSFYYQESIVQDELITLKYHIDFLRRYPASFEHALDYGCGPTLHNAIAVAPYAERLDMADWRADNLASIRDWVALAEDRSCWNHFTKYVLACEGDADPNPSAIAQRERTTRATIKALIRSDARMHEPLGADRAEHYDLLVSGYCLDCISGDRRVWREAMANVLSALRPGGALLLNALWRCSSYQVHDRWFPSANLEVDDLYSCLKANGFESLSLDIQTYAYPDQTACGYPGILVASGRKPSRRRMMPAAARSGATV
jgi:SAM-dependent methyltransferase